MGISNSIIAEFRRRVKDVRHSVRAFGLAVTDPQVTQALCEVTSGHLIVTVFGGTASSIDLDLTANRTDTIGALHQAISRMPGYRASLDEDASLDHASVDLEEFGPIPINGTGVDLLHHVFADSELEELLKYALQRHNPTLTFSTLPPQEWAFVMPLAQANYVRVQAHDASKRKGTAEDVQSLLALAESFERQYDKDTTRLSRALRSPKETNSNNLDEGDVMLGTLVRRSTRTGFMSPLAATIPPDYAVLVEPDEYDVEDTNVRIVWQRNKNVDFYSYELWMDTRPEVERNREGGLIIAGTPVADQQLPSGGGIYSSAQRLTTSKMVFRSFGSNSNSSRSSFSTFVEEFGQLIRSFSVGGLEPQRDYYFRLYVISINYIATSSNIVKARTKAVRCGFLPMGNNPNYPSAPSGVALSVANGSPGTVVNVRLDTTRAAFTSAHTFYFAGMAVTPSILSAGYALQFTVPSFQNTLNYNTPQDISIVSPNGLVDVQNQVFTVTPP